MKDLTSTEDLAKYVPQENEVLLNRAEKCEGFLIIPLSRPILSAVSYKDTTRPADALLLRPGRIRGPHGERLYEFCTLIDSGVAKELLKEHSASIGFAPHEKALPEINRVLEKLLGNSFFSRCRTPQEIRNENWEGLQRLVGSARMKRANRPDQPQIKERPKLTIVR